MVTRTPTQVASHAQKYFIRQLSGGKDKRRASIHDITTVNLSEPTRPPCLEDSNNMKNGCNSKQEANIPSATNLGQAHFQWNQHANAGVMGFNPYGVNSSYGMKMQGQNLHRSALLNNNNHDSSSYFGSPQAQNNMVFQMHSASAHHF